jgi:hypothetical protein
VTAPELPRLPDSLADPMATLRALGATVSPDLDAYASGRLPLSRVRCVLCRVAPCQCRQCAAPYRRRGAEVAEPCGMTIGPDGECPRGHLAAAEPAPGWAGSGYTDPPEVTP